MFIRETVDIAPDCLPSADAASSGVSWFRSPTGNCTYTCFPERRLLRSPQDVIAWPNSISPARDIVGIFLPMISSFLFGWLLGEVSARTWMREKLARNPNDYITTAATWREAVGLRWFARRFQTRDGRNSNPDIAQPSSPASISSSSATPRGLRLWRSFQSFIVFGNFAAFAANVVMTEYRIYSFPRIERANEVGQWAPWVSVGLVVLAQAFNHFAKKRGWGRDRFKLRSHVDEEQAPDAREPRDHLKKIDGESAITISRCDTMDSKRRNSF